jgi:hypothetical protein
MPTEKEIKDFAYFNKYGKMPTKKTKSNEGKLWYDGFIQAQGTFALLQHKKKELINRGFTPSKFRITY